MDFVRRFVLLLASASALAGSSHAQNNRMRAVAVDQVPIPPSDQYQVEAIGPALAAPWSIAFVPDGSFLVIEKHGGLRHIFPDGSATPPFAGGPPNVMSKEDSGLLDIALDPDFAANHTIYLAFAEGVEDANRTSIWKAQLSGDQMVGGRVIFRTNTLKKGTAHPGGRLLFLPDKTLLLTVGEGFDYRDKAQDPATHLGKILRLTREGRVPPDNPFIGRPGYAPEVYTLGHRNPQGLARDPVKGTIWEHEHGPRGGDEINEIIAGRNYGWPLVSNGIDYDGKIITDRAHAPGMTDPRFVWVPSIAPSGLAIYHGSLHPEWEGKLLVGALAARLLAEVRIGSETGQLYEDARRLVGLKARIRDVREGPDGNVYVLTDDEHGRLLRILPLSGGGGIPADSPLAPLSWLLGNWTGESQFTPSFEPKAKAIGESSVMDCAPALNAAYIRCNVRFQRISNGHLRFIENDVHQTIAKDGFDVLTLNSNWAGQSHYTMKWDQAEQAWVGYQPSDFKGAPATERIMDKVSADHSTVVHTEETRLNSTPNAPWTETFHWTWTLRPH